MAWWRWRVSMRQIRCWATRWRWRNNWTSRITTWRSSDRSYESIRHCWSRPQISQFHNRVQRLPHAIYKMAGEVNVDQGRPFHFTPSTDLTFLSLHYCRHSNGSGSGNGHDHENGEDHPDDAGSLSRSASEGSVAKTQNGLNSNNDKEQVNGYILTSLILFSPFFSFGSILRFLGWKLI